MSGEALQKALSQKRSHVAKGISLRKAVRDLQQETGIAFVVDRRIDPTSPHSLTTGLVSVRQNIQSLAQSADAAVSETEFAVVIAPAAAAGRLRTLIALRQDEFTSKRRKLSAAVTRSVGRAMTIEWPDGTQPRQLFVATAEQNGLTVTNADLIPHDVWAGAQLPPVTFSVLSSLVLNQFDLTFEFTGADSVTLIRVPEAPVIERSYRLPVRRREEIKATWTRMFPELDIEWTRTTAMVATDVETHVRLQQVIDGQQIVSVQGDSLLKRRITLNLSQGVPLAAILQSLESSKIPVVLEGLGRQQQEQLLSQTIRVSVKEMPLQMFIEKVFDGTGATVTVTDSNVRVSFR